MAQAGNAAQVAELLGLSPSLAADESAAVPALDVQVGKRVREARRRSGLDAAAVAEAVGLSRDKLSKIEHGKRRVAPRELPALARALSVSMASLLGTADAGRPALALAHRVAVGADAGATSGARARAVELLEAEDRLARRTELPDRQLSPAGAAIAQLVSQQYPAMPRTKAEASRQGRALAEEVRKHLELGTAEIGDLPALVEMHFAADVALSPLGEGSDGLCAHAGDAALLVVNTDYPLGRTRFTLAHELDITCSTTRATSSRKARATCTPARSSSGASTASPRTCCCRSTRSSRRWRGWVRPPTTSPAPPPADKSPSGI